jgi:N-acetylmuramoyl-L-alanine amidase
LYYKVLCFIFFFFSIPTFAGHSSTSHGLASAAARSAKVSSRALKPLIILDSGHGGSDEGAKVRKLQEKRLTLLTTLYAKRYLEEMGYRVILTRSKDVYVSLPKRVQVANKAKGALFVSIHFNSAKNTLAEGVEIFYYKDKSGSRMEKSRKLADATLKKILLETGATSRGLKIGNFHVIRETAMPAILVEAGFMTNYTEWELLRKKSYLEKIAKGVAEGVDKYLKP